MRKKQFTLKDYIIYIRKYIPLMLIAMLIASMGLGVQFMQPKLLGDMVDCISKYKWDNISKLIERLILYTILGILLINVGKFIIKKSSNKLSKEVRMQLFDSFLNYEFQKINKMESGELLAKFESDVTIFTRFFASDLVDFIMGVCSAVIIGIYIFKLNFLLAICIIASCFFQLLTVKRMGKIANSNYKKIRNLNEQYLSLLIEVKEGIKEIKLLNLHRKFRNLMSKSQNEYYSTVLSSEKLSIMLSITNSGLSLITNIIIILLAINQIKTGELTVGLFVAFMNYFNSMYNSLNSITNIHMQWQTAKVSMERIFSAFCSKNKDEIGALLLEENGELKVQDLSFGFHEEKSNILFENFSMDFKPGVVNILTGESGVGKTTLCELILGLYEIENGYIKLNKTNIKDINKINWWSYVSYCSQVPFFFSFTLEENFKCANNYITEKDIVAFLKKFGLADKIEFMHKDIINKMSIGQKQRLAVLRCILKKAYIYIFDEPTSALDKANTKIVADVINDLARKNKICIVITHDSYFLSLLKYQRILPIEGKEDYV